MSEVTHSEEERRLEQPGTLTKVARPTRAVEVLITPSSAQYHQLVGDLELLREAGAASNTAAILSAVRVAASTHGK